MAAPMDVLFVEAKAFTEVVERYFGDDEAYAFFQETLARSPERGRVIRGCGGLRKVRWPDPRRGKGRRGELRIICLHIPEVHHILLLDLYDKDETDDLSPADRTALAQMAGECRAAVLAGRRERRAGE